MKDKLYKMMDWPKIEGIVYAEEKHPEKILGCHKAFGGLLFQMFYPGAKEVSLQFVKDTQKYPMELADEAGFFAGFVAGKKEKEPYYYLITDEKGIQKKIVDPYDFEISFTKEQIQRFNMQHSVDNYELLGAHMETRKETEGVLFCVWAPNAVRVSVVGDFNEWNSDIHQMIFNEETGVFSLFIPNLKEGMNYKYDIKMHGGKSVLKADPYAFRSEHCADPASVIASIPDIKWTDKNWMKKREKRQPKKDAMSIYECNLLSFKDEAGKLLPLTEIAKQLIPYLKEMQYTHIELLPIMEFLNEQTNGFQTFSYYAFSSRYGSMEELMLFINALHQEEIGIILDWVPTYFVKDLCGLSLFDGTYLYGHLDIRQRENMKYHGYQFNYARPQVSSFLISNACFYLQLFHVDGLRLSGITSMLYLDYGKQDGEWVANKFGGNENLDGIDFLKQLNTILHKQFKGVVTIARETSAWPKITETVAEDGLGFDYVWNNGFIEDCLDFMMKPAKERINQISELTLSMLYAYSENYILALSHNEAFACQNEIVRFLPGNKEEQNAAMRAFYVYMMMHPGKKMVYMGQDCALNGTLNHLYRTLPALSSLDCDAKGFEWINCIDHSNGVISFFRKGDYLEDTLLITANFSENDYSSYKIGVPYEGKYKEILNSNQKEFGGKISLSNRYKVTKEEEYDGRINSLTLSIQAHGVSVYSFKPYTQEELLEIAEKKAAKIREKLEKEALRKAKAIKKRNLKSIKEPEEA